MNVLIHVQSKDGTDSDLRVRLTAIHPAEPGRIIRALIKLFETEGWMHVKDVNGVYWAFNCPNVVLVTIKEADG